MRESLSECPDCAGAGVVTFGKSPVAEECPRCRGTGHLYSADYRCLFAAMIERGGVFTKPEWRLLLEGLAALERRIEAIESELARRHDWR